MHAQAVKDDGGAFMKWMVVVKPPRFMSGILRFIFRVKKNRT
jgi:hypothetical protein